MRHFIGLLPASGSSIPFQVFVITDNHGVIYAVEIESPDQLLLFEHCRTPPALRRAGND